jgi:hypothetical protein
MAVLFNRRAETRGCRLQRVVCWKAFLYAKDDECMSRIEGRGVSLSVLLEIFPGRRVFADAWEVYLHPREKSNA